MKAVVYKIEKSKIKGNHVVTIHIPKWDLYFGSDCDFWNRPENIKNRRIGYTYGLKDETKQQFIEAYLRDNSSVRFVYDGHKMLIKKIKEIKRLLLKTKKMEKNNGKT